MPPLHPDPTDFAQLRLMHKRYMSNATVASWLLLRDAPAHSHVVRKEQAVQVSIASASSPQLVPHDAPHAPFPNSDDLMFLNRVEQGFALGHVSLCPFPLQSHLPPLANPHVSHHSDSHPFPLRFTPSRSGEA